MKADTQLVLNVQSGDKNAFEALVKRYQGLVFSVIYNQTGNLNQCHDLAQETFVTAWKQIKTLREPEKFKSWLCGIARNIAKNFIRVNKRQSHQIAESSLQVEDEFHHPLEIISTKENEQLVWNVLQSMPDTYRETLVLFYWEEHSIHQVAEHLEISEDAVKQRLSRGRHLLRDQMLHLVDDLLGYSAPKKAFTLAVMLSLPMTVPQITAAGILATSAEGSSAAKGALALASSGAFWGPLVGVLGAFLGVWAGWRSTKSDRERRFYIKGVAVVTSYMIGFAAMVFLPCYLFWNQIDQNFQNLNHSVFISIIIGISLLYTLGLFFIIYWMNRNMERIQKEEGTFQSPYVDQKNQTMSKKNIYISIAGGVFGSTHWLIVMALCAQDYVTPVIVLLLSVILYISSVKITIRYPKKYFTIQQFGLIACFLINIITVNIRWGLWMSNLSAEFIRSNNVPALWLLNIILIVLFVFLGIQFQVLKNRQRENMQ